MLRDLVILLHTKSITYKIQCSFWRECNWHYNASLSFAFPSISLPLLCFPLLKPIQITLLLYLTTVMNYVSVLWLSHNTSTQIFVMLFTPYRCNVTYFYGIWKWVDIKMNEQLLMTVDTKLCPSFMLVSLIILLQLQDYIKTNEIILNYYLLPHPKTCIVRHLWARILSILELWRLFSLKPLQNLLMDFICRKQRQVR